MQGEPRWILSERMLNAEGQSLLAGRCKLLVLGAGDGSPVPTNLCTTRRLISHESCCTGAAVAWAQEGSVGRRELLSLCRGREAGPSPMSQLHLFLMVCVQKKNRLCLS